MMGNMTLGNLIDWLEAQDQDLIVKDGFGSPHSDRGSYDELAFEPKAEAKISEMLASAKSAENKVFTGYKGGDFLMNRHTSVLIGRWGECGDEITPLTFKYWLSSNSPAPDLLALLKRCKPWLELDLERRKFTDYDDSENKAYGDKAISELDALLSDIAKAEEER